MLRTEEVCCLVGHGAAMLADGALRDATAALAAAVGAHHDPIITAPY